MTTDGKIRDEKLQYNINREASGKTDKYKFLAGEEILSPDQRRVMNKLILFSLL